MKRKKRGAALALLTALALLPVTIAAGPSTGPHILIAQAVTSQPRDTSDGEAFLGDLYTDPKNGFSIRMPAHWYLDKKNPHFALRLASQNPSYEAFIIIDVVQVPGPVRMDEEFQKFINQKNKEVKENIPGYQTFANRAAKVGNLFAYRTDATFQAGPNKILMSIYYVNGQNKIFMITTISPEASFRKWEPLFSASLSTFTLL